MDPRDGQWRYVGKSSSGLRRPRSHGLSFLNKERTYKANWIRQLQSLGLNYEIEVLEDLESADRLAEAEMEWIAECRRQGVALTNLTDGGEGALGFKQPPEMIEKRIAPLRGRKQRPEVVEAR